MILIIVFLFCNYFQERKTLLGVVVEQSKGRNDAFLVDTICGPFYSYMKFHDEEDSLLKFANSVVIRDVNRMMKNQIGEDIDSDECSMDYSIDVKAYKENKLLSFEYYISSFFKGRHEITMHNYLLFPYNGNICEMKIVGNARLDSLLRTSIMNASEIESSSAEFTRQDFYDCYIKEGDIYITPVRNIWCIESYVIPLQEIKQIKLIPIKKENDLLY